MKRLIAAALAGGLTASPLLADADDVERAKATGDVPATMDRLVAAVEGAGATVFARVDHAKGARDVEMSLAPSQLLIFGNPKLGTPAMQANPLAGIYLPMRVLVHTDAEGQTWLAYQEPDEMLEDLEGIDDDADYIEKMEAALETLTRKAAEG